MRRFGGQRRVSVAVLALIYGLGAGVTALAQDRADGGLLADVEQAAEAPSLSTEPAMDPTVERGLYLATAANCVACHTAPGGAPLAGGLPFKTDFGTIYSTNITPDAESGIGGWTLDQFERALRHGVRPDGAHLYPAFPYTSFTHITDADVADLYAWLMATAPVSADTVRNDMRFPFNQRWLMRFWNMMFFRPERFAPDEGRSAEWNRGAYLVEALAHCTACHTPRNGLGAERTELAYGGGVYTDRVPSGNYRRWSAPNLTSAANGLASWSVEELVAYLHTGKNSHAASFGPMNEVVMDSTRRLAGDDVRAMAIYLKALPPVENASLTTMSDQERGRGQTIYDLHCGTCHQPTGLGAPEMGARLDDSLIVQAADPSSLLNVIIYGPELSDPPPPVGEWGQMPSFNHKIEDDEIALLATFLRHEWGNTGGRVTVEQVEAQRPPYDSDF